LVANASSGRRTCCRHQRKRRIIECVHKCCPTPKPISRCWPCDACYETAVDLLWGLLADPFRAFGREAYCAGAEGKPESAAAERAIAGIGKLAQDGAAIDKLLNGLGQGYV
jgi:hypothetical protein